MSVGVEFPDLELILGPYLREHLASWSPLVDRRFPAPGWTPGYAVVIRDDSGPSAMVTATRSVGLTVIGSDYSQTRQLAERLAALIRALPDALALPIAAASVRGPYSLDAASRVEFYLTAELVVVGHSVTF